MSIPMSIHLLHKNVVIIGGGKQALRKVLQYQKEGAVITVVALAFLEEFDSLTIHKVVKAYDDNDIKDAFLCVAATNDRILNKQIICDANKQNILSLNVHKDGNASVSSMVSKVCKEYEIAVSTNGAYPLLNKRMLDDLNNRMEDTYKQRIQLLTQLRPSYIHNKELLIECMELPSSVLSFLVNAHKTKRAVLLAYHGNAHPIGLQDVQVFENTIQKLLPEQAVVSVFMASRVCSQVEDTFLSLEKLVTFLKEDINVTILPMLMNRGAYYEKYMRICNQHQIPCKPLMFQIESIRKQYLNKLKDIQKIHPTIGLLYHGNLNRSVYQALERFDKPIKVVEVKQFPNVEKNANISTFWIGMFMLYGNHMEACKAMYSKQDEILLESAITSQYFKDFFIEYVCTNAN